MESRREEGPGCQEFVNHFRHLPTATTIRHARLRHYGVGAVLLRRRLALAFGAEGRRPQVDGVRSDELLAARHARLAAAAVHLELELEPAFLARSGAVVTHRRPRGGYGALEH